MLMLHFENSTFGVVMSGRVWSGQYFACDRWSMVRSHWLITFCAVFILLIPPRWVPLWTRMGWTSAHSDVNKDWTHKDKNKH